MKRVIAAVFALSVTVLLLTGCMGDVVDVTVVLKNSTEHEISAVIFNIPQSSGTYSPMNGIITADAEPLKPGEERETVIGFVDTDFGNSGSALIGLEDYDGASDTLATAKGWVVLRRGTNRFVITHDGEAFVITAGSDAP